MNLGGTFLLHSILTHDQDPPPKSMTQIKGYIGHSKWSFSQLQEYMHEAATEGNMIFVSILPKAK